MPGPGMRKATSCLLAGSCSKWSSVQWTAQIFVLWQRATGISRTLSLNCIVLERLMDIIIPQVKKRKSPLRSEESDEVTWHFLRRALKLHRRAALQATWPGLEERKRNMLRSVSGSIGIACLGAVEHSLRIPLRVEAISKFVYGIGSAPLCFRKWLRPLR